MGLPKDDPVKPPKDLRFSFGGAFLFRLYLIRRSKFVASPTRISNLLGEVMRGCFRKVLLFGLEAANPRRSRLSKIGIGWGCLLVFLLFLQPAFPQTLNNFKPGSEPDGFGKIYWGMDVIILKDIEYSRKDPSYGGIDIYRKKGDDSCIWGVATKNIEYLFWKGRFCGILFFEEGFSGYERFRVAVSKEFGEGNKPRSDQEYYVWEGKKTLMALEYDLVAKRILFWMLGVSILRQMEQPDK